MVSRPTPEDLLNFDDLEVEIESACEALLHVSRCAEAMGARRLWQRTAFWILDLEEVSRTIAERAEQERARV